MRLQADGAFDLTNHALRIGAGQIDFVDDGNDLVVVVQRQVGVGQRLRLHALGGVHHQQRALACRQAARDLVGKVHVAGRINQIQLVGFPIPRLVENPHGTGFDGDATLPLEVHVVEHLLAKFPPA